MSDDLAKDVRALAAGVRAVVGGLSVALSIFNIRVALLIPAYQQIFIEALPGKPLPYVTQFVIWAHIALVLLAILLPIAVLVILFVVRSHKTALVVATVMMVAVFVQTFVTTESLMSPMFGLITGMDSDSNQGH